MSDYLVLYLLTRGSAIQNTLFIFSLCTLVVIIACVSAYGICNDRIYSSWSSTASREYYMKLRTAMSRWIKASIAAGIFFALTSSFIPSNKDVAMIVGGKFALDVSRSLETSQLVSAVKDRIIRELNNDVTLKEVK